MVRGQDARAPSRIRQRRYLCSSASTQGNHCGQGCCCACAGSLQGELIVFHCGGKPSKVPLTYEQAMELSDEEFDQKAGTLTLHLDDVLNGKPIFSGTEITWAFDAAPSATPEPASMLLFGTGVGAMLVARRRAARAAHGHERSR